MCALMHRRLNNVYQCAKSLELTPESKYVFFSDCHRGQGNAGDNFLQNQTVYFGALNDYYKKGFTYVELGDGDELWENRSLNTIMEAHSDVFWLLSKYYKEGRFHMLYGNHDMVKKKPSFFQKTCNKYYCDISRKEKDLFPGLLVTEGIRLVGEDQKEIFLVHGHQGSLLNDVCWKMARFLVRYLWGPMELLGFLDPTGSGMPRKKKEKAELEMADFAKEKQVLLIAGHTHRPVFSSPEEGNYFNDGSCVHPRCITGIEIENYKISLIKWAVNIGENQMLFVGKTVLEGPVDIKEYFQK